MRRINVRLLEFTQTPYNKTFDVIIDERNIITDIVTATGTNIHKVSLQVGDIFTGLSFNKTKFKLEYITNCQQ